MTFRMPAEWTEHEGCLMAWPTRADLWGDTFASAKTEYALVARAISEFEPVTMVTVPGAADEARELCGEAVTVIEIPIDDAWFRDSGPIFVTDADGRRSGVDFRFNAWGRKHSPWDSDDRVAAALIERVGDTRIASDMILEGGAITVDGEGTLITTEQCLLHPNRNPDMTREEIEAEIKARLGVEKIIWLPYGGALDTETDGHVDGVCAFVAPAKVVVQLPDDPEHPDYVRSRANKAVLEASTDAQGRPFEVVAIPQSNSLEWGGVEIEVSYLNFYIANGGVVVPVADHPSDAGALAVIQSVFPDRKVVGVPTPTVAYGGGGVHCITQQVPVARKDA
ncbi:agmatine deiminase family protein [Yinghuangia seranimata]|uniref:agmatine deiminase family protein n=1 Tax=Yinghuangia seranimata TaxID=408067 RepID=UPI00248CBAEB|nr:agmatine deiminase family protein [Yinghuangia seranimata]MDI2125626.1 agmatine deiminase family protein [Yinghuangia seranimata]